MHKTSKSQNMKESFFCEKSFEDHFHRVFFSPARPDEYFSGFGFQEIEKVDNAVATGLQCHP